MTLVGSFLINNIPLLIGDILLSAPDAFSPEVPTIENVTDVFPQGSGYVPSGLQQKIAVISSDFVIGWTGRLFAAKAVIRELYEMNQKKPFTHSSLMLYFDSLKKANFNKEEGFVGFIKDSTGINRFDFNSLETQITSLGRVQLLGSGAEDLAELLPSVHLPSQPIVESLDNLQRALLSSLAITGALLSTEIATHKSLLNYYGAGYEIVSIVNGEFGKFGDVTYLFWYPIKMGNGFQMRLRHISKYTYIRDVLLIRSVRIFRPFSSSENLSKNNHGHSGSLDPIPPIYRDFKPNETDSFQMPSLNSGLYCNFFMAFDSPSKRYNAFTVIKLADKEGTISITEEGERVSVHIDPNWLNRVIEQNLSYINEN